MFSKEHMPSVEHNNWLKNQCLEALKHSLAKAGYPGYPLNQNRLWDEDDQEIKTLPLGPWETSDGATPTIPEQNALHQKGLLLDTYGRPLHPWFDEMLHDPEIGVVTGKGAYWNWGPNYTADPVVIRRDREEPYVLLILRKDTGAWALPGGFIDQGEPETAAAIRETREETGLNLESLGVQAQVFYQGPVADIRVTAHAWPETTGVLFEIPNEYTHSLTHRMWLGGDDADTAAWVPVSELDNRLFGSHRLLIDLAMQS